MQDTEAATRSLSNLIAAERLRVRNSAIEIDSRIAILELSRALDTLCLYERQAATLSDQSRTELEEIAPLYRNGWTIALELFPCQCEEAGTPILNSTPQLQRWADSVLQHCGRIALFERMLDYCRAGLASVSLVSPGNFEAVLTALNAGVEYIEQEEFARATKIAARRVEASFRAIEQEFPSIRLRMARNVECWKDHYIQYTTEPEIDAYFEAYGNLTAQLMHGHDAFPGEISFGGSDFSLYVAATRILVGWALKHIAFSGALQRTENGLDLRNLVSVPQPAVELAGYLAAALDITECEAFGALDVLTLRPDNRAVHCSVGGAPAPPLVQVGKDRVLTSLAGCLTNPFLFMLRELRDRYTADWDKAVDARESAFRDELYSLFSSPRYFTQRKRVELKKAGKAITDIDAVVFDYETGTLGLFQLKWQDTFGNSMRERRSRRTNFKAGVDRWLDVICGWLDSISVEQVAAKCMAPARRRS